MGKMYRRNQAKIDQLVFALVVLPLVAVPANAEENTKTVKADDIVVTATRTETSVDDAPASVTVLTKEDIKNIIRIR